MQRIQLSGTTPTTRTITVGFRPKCGLMWGGRFPSQSNNYLERDVCPGLGFWDDEFNNACLAVQNLTGEATSECRKRLSDTYCLVYYTGAPGDADVVDEGKVTAVSDTTFTFVTDTEAVASNRILMLTFGGDDITGTMVGTFNEPDQSDTGVKSVPGDADVQGIKDGHGIVFFLGAQHPSSKFDENENGLSWSCGMAVSATKQGASFFGASTGAETQTCFQSYKNDHCLLSNAAPNTNRRHTAKFSQWLDDGTNFLELDWDLVNFSNNDAIMFLVIKGGDWDMGFETVPTSTGTKETVTTTLPKIVVTQGMAVIGNQDNVAEDISFNMAMAITGSQDFSYGSFIEEGVETMFNSAKSSNNDVHTVLLAGLALGAESDLLEAPDDLKFTLDYQVADGTEWMFNWFVAGDSTQVFGHGSWDGYLPGAPQIVKPWHERNVVSKEPFQLLLSARPKMLDPFTLTIDSVPHMVQHKMKVFNMLVHVQASQAMPPLKLGGIPRMQKPLGFSVGAGARYSHKPTQVVKIKVEAKDAHHYHLTLYGKKLKGMWYINEAKRRGVQIGNTLSFQFREAGRLWHGAITNIPPVGDPEPEPSQEREVSFDEPSTVVGRVTYNIDFQSMEVELNATVYNYCNVPQSIFDSFAGAASKGAFYNRAVKGQFSC